MRVEGWVYQVKTLPVAQFILLYHLTKDGASFTQLVNKGNLLKPVHGAYMVAEGQLESNCHKYPSLILTAVSAYVKPTKDLPYRLDESVTPKTASINRVFDLRRPSVSEIFLAVSRIKHRLLSYFAKGDWVVIDTPKIQSASAESGGAELFAVNFYGKVKYLAQSPQLYKQVCANIFGRVYQFGNIYRAECSDTPRHLAEASCLDVELVTTSLNELYEVAESLLKAAGLIGGKLPVYKYDDLCEKIGKTDRQDFNTTELKTLGDHLPAVYLIEQYPAAVKPFYIKCDGSYAKGFDIYYKQVELASGGLRQHNASVLLEQMLKRGIATKELGWYLSNFQYVSRPHGGFSIGLNRLYQVTLGLSDVKQVTLFPVTYKGVVY